MEPKEKESNSKAKLLLIVILTITSIVFLSCILLQVTPLELEWMIFDFAQHHYFLVGFLSLLIALVSINSYLSKYYNLAKGSKKSLGNALRSSFHRHKKRTNSIRSLFKSDTDKSAFVFVDKKAIDKLNFSQADVLNSIEEKKLRENELQKAMRLGNNYKHKVKIFFRDINSKRYTETTIWYADQKSISLKGGILLPVRSIYKVEI